MLKYIFNIQSSTDEKREEERMKMFAVLVAVITAVFLFGGCDDQNAETSSDEPPITVAFDSDGGTDVPSQHLRWREKVAEPEAPVKDGYAFLGWYEITAGNIEKLFDFAAGVEKDVLLKAKWTTWNVYDFIQAIRTMRTSGTVKAHGSFNDDALLLVKNTLLELAKGTPIGKEPSILFTLDLSEVTGLSALPSSAFYGTIDNVSLSGCINLEGILFPESLKTIGSKAFYGCSNLKSIEIPDSVSEIGDSAFKCESINFSAKLAEVKIGKGVTTIGDSAFAGCKGLARVEISDGSALTAIGKQAFYQCYALENMIIPESVTAIGEYAFYNCIALTNIEIPDNVEKIGKYAFAGCRNVTSLTLSDCEMGDHVFSECTKLTDIVIKKSVSAIGDYAFYRCTSITNITIPGNVRTIGKYAFAGDENGTRMQLAAVHIETGVQEIGDGAFAGCKNLTNVEISDGMKTIGNSAFQNCGMLEKIMIPGSVTTIGGSAFRGCAALSYITLPEKLTEISDNLFQNSGLIEINIPGKVKKIGDNAFYNCSSLSSVIVPPSVWTIGIGAFRFCKELTEATFENGGGYSWYATNSSDYRGGDKIASNGLLAEMLVGFANSYLYKSSS